MTSRAADALGQRGNRATFRQVFCSCTGDVLALCGIHATFRQVCCSRSVVVLALFCNFKAHRRQKTTQARTNSGAEKIVEFLCIFDENLSDFFYKHS